MRYIRATVVYVWAVLVMSGALPLVFWSQRKRVSDYCYAMNKMHTLVHWFAGTIVSLAGVQLEVEGIEHIPNDGSVLFIGNHQSFFDIPILLSQITRPTGFVAKEELKKVPLLSRWIKGLDSVYIVRGETRKALAAIIEAINILKRHPHGLVVFPEGTRSKDGTLGEFKAGVMKIAQRSQSAVVPFAIDGSHQVMPTDRKTFTPCTVKLIFFPAMSPNEIADMESGALARQCQALVADALGQTNRSEEVA